MIFFDTPGIQEGYVRILVTNYFTLELYNVRRGRKEEDVQPRSKILFPSLRGMRDPGNEVRMRELSNVRHVQSE